MDKAQLVLDSPPLSGFERLVRALLAAAADFGGFDIAFLTVVDWSRREQRVRFAHNVGPMEVVEGHAIACPPGLDEQTFLGVTRSNGLPTPQPDGLVASGLGMATYVSVPVVTISHRLYGTLCGASRAAVAVDDAAIAAMQCFAALLSDHMARDDVEEANRHTAEVERTRLDRARFLAESEHKLKTHLAVISGWATTLSEAGHRLSPDERMDAIEVIRRQSDELGAGLQGCSSRPSPRSARWSSSPSRSTSPRSSGPQRQPSTAPRPTTRSNAQDPTRSSPPPTPPCSTKCSPT